jgi:hypothetical protein
MLKRSRLKTLCEFYEWETGNQLKDTQCNQLSAGILNEVHPN